MGNAVAKKETGRLPALAKKIEGHHKAVYGALGYVLDRAMKCGDCLIEAKALVKHGEWMDWMKENVSFSQTQANKYMTLANNREKVMQHATTKFTLGENLPINDAVALLAKPKPEPELDKDGEAPNIGCNYDPADPRGYYESDDVKTLRRRAWLYMARESKSSAESFLAEHGHRAIAIADPSEVDDEVIKAARDAKLAWERVKFALEEKRASVAQRAKRPRMTAPNSETLFAKLEAELKAHKRKRH